MIVNQKFTIIPFISSVREAILRTLASEPMDGGNLLESICKETPVSKQGLYKALRELSREEIIIKEQTLFSLNKAWLSRLKDFIEKGEENYGWLLPAKRKVITFKDANSLDIYWGHLFLTLAEQYKNKQFFFFNHHSLFIHERPHSELYLFETTHRKKYKVTITLGVDTLVARQFKQRFGNNNIQITIDNKFSIAKTENVCVIGDYVITTKYGQKTTEKIDKLFRNSLSFSEYEKNELHQILSACKNPKIIIVRNERKSNIWKRRFAKNFMIKKSEL